MKKFVMAKMLSLILVGTASAGSIHSVAVAIAKTEGFFVRGTKPSRYHNPGDIRRFRGTPYVGEAKTDRQGYVIFRNDAFGWQALDQNLQRIVDGTSGHYRDDATFAELARAYATDRRWGRNVCAILGVDAGTTLREYLGLAPRILLTRSHDDDTLMRLLFQRTYDLPELREMPEMLSQVRRTN